MQAFQVLEQVFIRGRTVILCDCALEGILNVYRRDPANYFILAAQQTISAFAEPLLEKKTLIFPKFFAVLEYVALELSYVPSKELVSLSLILKDDRWGESFWAVLWSTRCDLVRDGFLAPQPALKVINFVQY